mgnify:CR=1 FL=1
MSPSEPETCHQCGSRLIKMTYFASPGKPTTPSWFHENGSAYCEVGKPPKTRELLEEAVMRGLTLSKMGNLFSVEEMERVRDVVVREIRDLDTPVRENSEMG